LARLFRRQVEQPEVLRGKWSLRVDEGAAIWKESIALSFDPKPAGRQFDIRPVGPNGQERRIDADVGPGVDNQISRRRPRRISSGAGDQSNGWAMGVSSPTEAGNGDENGHVEEKGGFR
jgi:hypothetical protein